MLATTNMEGLLGGMIHHKAIVAIAQPAQSR